MKNKTILDQVREIIWTLGDQRFTYLNFASIGNRTAVATALHSLCEKNGEIMCVGKRWPHKQKPINLYITLQGPPRPTKKQIKESEEVDSLAGWRDQLPVMFGINPHQIPAAAIRVHRI